MSADRNRGAARRSRPTAKTSFNYYRSNRPSPEPKAKSRGLWRRLLRRLTESVTLLVVLALVVYSLMVNSSPKVEVTSQLYHNIATYDQAVKSQMKSFWNRNKITFDEVGLTKKLQQNYPEIASLSVRLPLISQRATVRLDIAQPSFKLISQGQAYLVGEQGSVVAQTAGSQWRNLPVLDDHSGYAIKVGQPALESKGVSFINQLLAQLKQAKVPVRGMVLPARAQELELRTKDRDYFVKFYLGGDPLASIGQYLAARHHFDKTHHQPSRYVDVRVPGKIFYR